MRRVGRFINLTPSLVTRAANRLLAVGGVTPSSCGALAKVAHLVSKTKKLRSETVSMGRGRALYLRGYEVMRSEEHTSELQSLMRISYAVFSLKKKISHHHSHINTITSISTINAHSCEMSISSRLYAYN